MANFRAGTQEQVDSGEAEYVSGGIPSKEITSYIDAQYREVDRNIPGTQGTTRKVTERVGGDRLQHRTVTTVTQGPDGSVTGGETVLYTVQDGKYVPTAITKDGAKSWQFEDSKFPSMTGVANDKLKKDLASTESAINKNSLWQIDTSTQGAGIPKKDQSNLSRSKNSQALTDAGLAQLNNVSLLKTRPGTRNTPGAFGGLMIYPEGLGQSDQDRIKIDMVKFLPRSLTSTQSGFTQRQEAGVKDIIGTVMLAIPGGIRDDNRVNWGSQDMNPAQAKIARLAFDFISKGQSPNSVQLEQLSKDLTDPLTKTAVALGFAGAAVGAQGLLARTEGAVLNPNTELLFSGPTLRAFTFQFPFSPRSKPESEMVQRIIRFFKQGMAVQRTDRDLFLKTPNVFQLKFLKGENNPHEFLPKIKTCALLNCAVDYTPDGNYSTHTNSSMTSYTMSLTFNELDPLFNDEYETEGEDATTNNIGF
tara:strand:- start:646 stop:2070 length:1425 start_codon:yes stop_codon:yes gene_type:complete